MKEYWNSVSLRLGTETKDGDRVLAEVIGVSLESVRNSRYRGYFTGTAFPAVLSVCLKLDEPFIPDPRAFRWKKGTDLKAFLDLIDRVKRDEERPEGAAKPAEAQPEPPAVRAFT